MNSQNNKIITVLVCDDSAILRRLTKQALSMDARIKVIGESSNGQEALDFISVTRPDIVVLDVEMPVMDGVDTLRAIRRRFGDLPVIMFSSITRDSNSEATIDALTAGANDFVTKPSSVGSLGNALQQVGQSLCAKIHLFVDRPGPNNLQVSRLPSVDKNLPLRKNTVVNVVGIGSSTGGPAALAQVIERLPATMNVPVLITQHMPASFIAPLATRLTQVSSHDVRPAGNNEELCPGKVLIAPGDLHLCLVRKNGKVFTSLQNGPPVNSCRPAVDCMFESIAKCYHGNSLGVVLTGMGRDGKQGAQAIKDHGGIIFAQDETSSVVYGMPREVVNAGLADRVLPIDQIGFEISRLLSSSPVGLTGAVSSIT